MKKLNTYLLLSCLLFNWSLSAQISVFDCDLLEEVITQHQLESTGEYNFFRPCVDLGLPEFFSFTQNSHLKIMASKEIHLRNGVSAGGFDQNAGIWFKIEPYNEFDVAVMNYPDLNDILRYNRLELGVSLSGDINDKINAFINKLDVPETNKLNPYVDWDMKVYASFSHPSLSEPIVIDGFYTKDFVVNPMQELPEPQNEDWYSDYEYNLFLADSWSEINTHYPFRLRFAPPENGLWEAKVFVKVGETIEYESNVFQFNVVESGSLGYIKAGKRYLLRNNKTFYPVGCNVRWPEINPIYDPELYELSHGFYDGNSIFLTEGYSSRTSLPMVYDSYRNILKLLADNGANYFRMIMSPTSTDIEYEEAGNYTKRLNMAYEMDRILEYSEQRGMYIHWNMQLHYNFQRSKNAYDRAWVWDDTLNPYCYRELVNDYDPVDFFTNPEAKKYYEQRIRYIFARWGYSTNVAIFELFSEINNVGSDVQEGSEAYENNWQVYRDWQVEMGNYIKNMYHGKIHLLTTNFITAKASADDVFTYDVFDVMTSNIYDWRDPSYANHYINTISRNYLNEVFGDSPNCYSCDNHKPLLSSESDAIETDCDENLIEIQRNMWQAVFSGLAGSFSWTIYRKPHLFPIFRQIRDFIEDVELEGEGWHPGASGSHLDYWVYMEDYADNMDGNVNPRWSFQTRERHADISYLRSYGGNYAIGVITNKTYNVYTADDCLDSYLSGIYKDDEDWPDYFTDGILNVNTDTERLMVRGMNSSRYYINYFHPSNLSTPIHSSDNMGSNVRVQYTIPGTYNDYITLFKVRQQNYNWLATYAEEDTVQREITHLVDPIEDDYEAEVITTFNIYPNPSNKTITLISSHFPRTGKIYITSIEGKTVQKEIQLNELETVIDVSRLESGTYFINLVVENEFIQQFTFVKI